MRERHLIEHAGTHLLQSSGGLLARECRLVGGAGRADGLALWLEGDAVCVHALEAKSRHAVLALLPRRSGWYGDAHAGGMVGDHDTPLGDAVFDEEVRVSAGAEAPLHVPALQQLGRYPGDFAWLVSAAHALDDVPELASTLRRVCAGQGVGWLEVDWHGEVRQVCPALRRASVPFCEDALEPYARGALLRAALRATLGGGEAAKGAPGPSPGKLPRSTTRVLRVPAGPSP